MVNLQPPALEVRIAIAGIYLGSSVPDRVALQALALCLSWPSPPWEAAAQVEVDRASQEEREARQFLQVARPEEKSGARSGLLQARADLQAAQAALAALRPSLRDVRGDALEALSRLQAAGVPVAVWSGVGQSLVNAWTSEMLPASESEIAETYSFTLPPSAPTSGGGSNLPTTTPATP